MHQPRLVFAGTPKFALASLEALVGAGHAVAAVLTQPDRRAGRGRRLTESPVKRFAREQDIPVMQPATLKDEAAVAGLRAVEPDALIVAAYGLLLPQTVLDIPSGGCINVHASLLPRWRGAAPIQAAIREGDTETGVCLMQMTAGLDCGPVYTCEATAIGATETAGELHDRLAALGANLLVRNLGAILAGDLGARDQDETGATYAGKIGRDDARLDWQHSASELDRHVRAFNPVPGAFFELDGEAVKCWNAEPLDTVDAVPGQVVAAGKEGVTVACGAGGLRLTRVQRPGRKAVTGAQFATQIDLVGRRL